MAQNPLKQYFRSPALYFKLPSDGKFYAEGVVDFPPNRDLPVYPMTVSDEVAVRNPDGLFNGSSIVQVIKSCIPAINDPWQLNSIDMEAVLVAIRAASNDGKVEVSSRCPSCTNESKYEIDLGRVLAEKRDIDYDTTLDLGELTIKFKPLIYEDITKDSIKQFEIQRMMIQVDALEDNEQKNALITSAFEKLNELTREAILQSIVYIKTPETTVSDKEFIMEFLKECDAKTSKLISDTSTELRQKNSAKPINITCGECEHKYEQPLILNFTDFFA
jgi:hypothetical protein